MATKVVLGASWLGLEKAIVFLFFLFFLIFLIFLAPQMSLGASFVLLFTAILKKTIDFSIDFEAKKLGFIFYFTRFLCKVKLRPETTKMSNKNCKLLYKA